MATGGMTTASLLAQMGQKVLVLEQHDRIGGCTHTFEFRKNGEMMEFDTGLHYVSAGKKNMLGPLVPSQLFIYFGHIFFSRHGQARVSRRLCDEFGYGRSRMDQPGQPVGQCGLSF
jgi:UDP-galactopyranose mutase